MKCQGQVRLHIWTTVALVPVLVWLVACGGESAPRARQAVSDDDVITVASFDFTESEILASVYAQALEAHGFDVELRQSVGPRELLLPALMKGLVELIPEYAGTSLAFVSRGEFRTSADSATTHGALADALAVEGLVVAMAPSPAQSANAVVVTPATAEQYGLLTISDLAEVDDALTFGGPPECPSRPFCLLGLESLYGLHFDDFLALDAGGPATREALTTARIDVGLLFTTDPAIGSGGLVALDDDLGLQQAENVTPLVNSTVVARWGPRLTHVLDDVSERLSTAELRTLNGRVADGATPDEVATAWLKAEGL